MTYRILADENTSPRVAELLRGRGRDAAHVGEALDLGAADRRIVEYADEHGFVILTHDDDFLRSDYNPEVRILYYSDETFDTYESADRIEEVIRYVPDPSDLPPVTNIGTWR